MQKWEYSILLLNTNGKWIRDDIEIGKGNIIEINEKPLKSYLDIMGNEGWELGQRVGLFHYFKRPKP